MADGYLLAVDLSSATASLALHRENDAALIAERVLPAGHTHVEALLVTLDDMLRGAGVALPAVGSFVTPSGPGSFTGLRVAMASLKAFAMALDRPLETLSGAEARADAWAREAQRKVTKIVAATQISSREFARCEMALTEAGLSYVGESTVSANGLLCGNDFSATVLLLDERMSPEEIDPALTERFPLRARYLVPALRKAATRRSYHSLAEWIEAVPNYFGGDRFR
jgi:tRNA threonylcarbamoyl adenosine modification protein YeaZ